MRHFTSLPAVLFAATALVAASCDGPTVGLAQQRLASTNRALNFASDLTLDDSFDAGTNWFTATLPAATVVGTLSQEIEGDWDATVHNIGQVPIYPQGWTLSYYAGANLLAAPPSTPAQWSSVTRVVTSGAAEVEGLDGLRQALVADISAPPATFPSSFSGNSTGDGWNVFFDPAHTMVFNEHHHDSPADVMCHLLADSGVCPGYPIALTQTSARATGVIDVPTNKMWQPTVTYSGFLAWDCVDLTASARCATPTIQSATAAAGTFYGYHTDPVVIGRKLYAIAANASNIAQITCLDMSTGAECAGVVLPESFDWGSSGIDAAGNNLYAIGHGSGYGPAPTYVRCYDSTTMTACPGSWPQATTSTGRIHITPSADGTLANVCADWQCWQLDGGATTLPPNYLAYASANREGALAGNYPYYANYAHAGSRVAWFSGGSLLQCWDMATDAKCSAGFPVTVNRPYSAEFDPLTNDCVWTNGDDGIIRNYYVPSGAQGCASGPPQISFQASISIPRLGCDPASRVFEYKSFSLLNPPTSAYTSATLTVKNSFGAPIPGWINVPIPVDGGSAIVDLTSLSTSIAGQTPEFDVLAAGFTDKTLIPSAEFRVTTGATPQLCWGLAVPSLTCPATAGLATGGSPVPVQTTVTAKGTFDFADAGATAYTDQSDVVTVTPNTPNATNCGTQLNATLQYSSGGPAAGVLVALLDGNGNPVLDASSNPVFGTSAANGSLSFVVWPSNYRLSMSDQAAGFVTSLQVTSGGSGTTTASGGVVTSNLLTTNSSTTAAVLGIITSRPIITAPANGALTNNRNPTVAGSCLTGSLVSISEGGTQLCIGQCVGSAFSCVSASLADGSHTLVAAQTVSNTSSIPVTFTVDSTRPVAPAIQVPASGAFLATSTPVISGSCVSGDTVSVSENGNVLCTAPCAASAFSCTSSALVDGSHTIAATQIDAAGNLSPQSGWVSFTIETVAPGAPSIVVPAAGAYVATSTPVVSGSCSSPDFVNVYEGANLLCSSACTGGAFSCATSTLPDGPHTVTATQTDQAGNVSASSAPRSFTILTSGPVAPAISVPASGAFLATSMPAISGSCLAPDTVTVFEGANALCSAACMGGSFSCTSSALVDGPHTISATQTDQAGNVSPSSASVSFTVITVAPVAPVITQPTAGAYVNATPVLSGTCVSGDTVNVSENGNVLCSGMCTAGAFTCQSSSLADGPHTVAATQTDPAGNVSPQSGWVTFNVDTTAPGAPAITAPQQGSSLANPTPTITGSCNIGDLVSVSEGATVLCTATCVGSAFSCVSSSLADGLHTITAVQTDLGGNLSPSSAPRSFTVQTATPVAPAIVAPAQMAYLATSTPTISGTCETSDSVNVVEGGGTLCSAACAAGAFSCVSVTLLDGMHTVTALQTNPAGTSSVASPSRSFIIQATQADEPLITSPLNGADVYAKPTPFAGSAEPNTSVSLMVDGVQLCTASVSAQGAWQCSGVVAVGPHVATATETDQAGTVSVPSAPVNFTQRDAIDVTQIVSPVSGATLYGPSVPVSGTAKASSQVVITDALGNSFCTATTDPTGVFQCTGQAAAGPLTLTADATWQTFQSKSAAVPVTVLLDTRVAGGGCSAGGSGVGGVGLLAVIALALSRRRREARA